MSSVLKPMNVSMPRSSRREISPNSVLSSVSAMSSTMVSYIRSISREPKPYVMGMMNVISSSSARTMRTLKEQLPDKTTCSGTKRNVKNPIAFCNGIFC